MTQQLRHCPNCDGEVVIWDSEIQAYECLDCDEKWGLEEEGAVKEMGIERLRNHSPIFRWLEGAVDGEGCQIDDDVVYEEAQG